MTDDEVLPLIEHVEYLIGLWRRHPTKGVKHELVKAMRKLKNALEQ